ncbi:HNH endonuclease [Neptunicella sp.]|uniref:HNH endonuclease n=1 Tax=Neptunicella sp. TaxID=2125986 RepID=UPI003F694030
MNSGLIPSIKLLCDLGKFMFLDYGDKITGIISKDLLNGLTDTVRECFLETVRIKSSADGYVHFEIPNESDAEKIYEIIRKYEKNKMRSESRKASLYILSSGTYEKEDIDALYEAQQGLCYYTGQPLNKKPQNFAIDHVIPVTEGGSSWPSNLVLATVEINREKHNNSKRKMFSILEKRNGKDWVKKQREFCKVVDVKRRSIDKNRRTKVSDMLNSVEANMRDLFPGEVIDYALIKDDIELFVNHTVVNFPAGFIRQKRKCFSSKYIEKLVEAILEK